MPRQHVEGSRKLFEKRPLLEPLKPRKLSPRRGESMILRFCPIPEKLDFELVVESHFGAFGLSYRRKQSF